MTWEEGAIWDKERSGPVCLWARKGPGGGGDGGLSRPVADWCLTAAGFCYAVTGGNQLRSPATTLLPLCAQRVQTDLFTNLKCNWGWGQGAVRLTQGIENVLGLISLDCRSWKIGKDEEG